MHRLALLCALSVALPALAADRDDRTRKPADMVILSDPAEARTVGKARSGAIVLQQVPGGTIGKAGKHKVMLQSDGMGTTLGKVGDRRLLCHTDAASGVTLCK